MEMKKGRSNERLSLFIIIVFILLTFSSCNDKTGSNIKSNMTSGASIETRSDMAADSSTETLNQKTDTDSFDINVQINYRVTIDKNIKEINPNIVRATRQAVFDYECSNAKFSHYNGFIINHDICIFEVNETGKNTWQVKFWEKPQNSDSYIKDGFCSATVDKQDSGSYKGYVINSGGPMIRGDETY